MDYLRNLVVLLACGVLVFLTGCCMLGGKCPGDMSEIQDEEGRELVKNLWVNIEKSDIQALDKMMCESFQSVHQFGALDKQQELELLKKLDLKAQKITDLKISGNRRLVIATYKISAEETIEGKRLSAKPAPRMSIFFKSRNGWQWVAHANLKPMDEAEK